MTPTRSLPTKSRTLSSGSKLKYNKDDFLAEVYMTSEQYDVLFTLLTNKQNLILQGAPGVGKTFAAKIIASELEVNFYTLESSQIHSKWV